MKILTLKRLCENECGVFGVLLDDKIPLCVTLERTWEDNRTNVSCIPAGEYMCVRSVFPKHGETFEVTNVPNRTTILLHKGNFATDSNGCILIGSSFGEINRQWAILDSGKAFSDLYKYLAGINEFKLIVQIV